jgi:signal transduction histidine kinase
VATAFGQLALWQEPGRVAAWAVCGAILLAAAGVAIGLIRLNLWRLDLLLKTFLAGVGAPESIEEMQGRDSVDLTPVYELRRTVDQSIDDRIIEAIRNAARFYHHEFANQLVGLEAIIDGLADLSISEEARQCVVELRANVKKQQGYVIALNEWRRGRPFVGCDAAKAFHELQKYADVPWLIRTTGSCRIGLPLPLLRGIVTNLVSNARKHASDNETVKVDVSEVERDGERCVRIAVIDSGPDLDDRRLAQIFRYPDAASAHGFGLAICRALAKSMGGELVYERMGQGWKCFSVYLPATASE